MKKIILAILIVIPLLVKAQVPGYQGKRLIVYYNLSVAPNFIQAVYNSKPDAGLIYPFQIHLCHSISAEYVLSRRFSLEGEFSFLENKPILYTYVNDNFNNEHTQTYPLDIVMTGIGINFVFYPASDNTLGPVGNFVKLKLAMKSYTATGITLALDSSLTNTVTNTTKSSGTLYGIGLEVGHHLVLKDKVVLSASLSFDFNLPTPDAFSPEGNFSDTYNHMLDNYIAYLKFGIGGLLH